MATGSETREPLDEITPELEELIHDHLDLVHHVVHQVAMRYPRHVDRDELWNAGALGLVDAARRYDPTTGIPFGRYAMIRIRGAIIDSTRSRDWATRATRRNIRELRKTVERLRQAEGREPSRCEVAEALEVEVDQVDAIRASAVTASLLHLDQRVGTSEGEDTTLGDLVEDDDPETLPEEMIEQRELVGTLHVAIDHLPDVQGEVVRRYYFGNEYLRDIAESLGVTEARVSQIRSEALTAIRAYFGTTFDGVPDVDPGSPGRRNRTAFLEAMTEQTNWRARLGAADRTVVPGNVVPA